MENSISDAVRRLAPKFEFQEGRSMFEALE
jgi:hypothetical protein